MFIPYGVRFPIFRSSHWHREIFVSASLALKCVSEGCSDGGEELARRERLLKEVGGASLDGQLPASPVNLSRHENNWDVSIRSAQSALQFQAVHSRHEHIKNQTSGL